MKLFSMYTFNTLKNRVLNQSYMIMVLFFFIFGTCSCAAGSNTQTGPVDPKRFSDQINTFLKWDNKNSYPQNALLFVGSSSIRFWHTASFFPNYKIINRGFGGAHISDVNYYYKQIVANYKPAKIIFYAGDNDIAAGKSADQVLKDFQIFIRHVARDLPEAQVFFISIKPSLQRWELWPEMSLANGKIQAFIESKPNMFYVDIAQAMLDKKPAPNPALFFDDGLHLNYQGYKLWTEILTPYIEKGTSK